MNWSGRWHGFWHWLGKPFRAIVALSFQQVRSLFAIAMLCGIIALSLENWALMSLAHHSISSGEVVMAWFGLLIERTRYNSALQAWFSVILGLVVFGAEYFRAKWGDKEIGAGRGNAPPPPAPPERRAARRDEEEPDKEMFE